MRGKPWEPLVLAFYLRSIGRGARQAHEHLVTEAEASIVPAGWLDGLNRQFRPMRELSSDKTMYKRYIDDGLKNCHGCRSNRGMRAPGDLTLRRSPAPNGDAKRSLRGVA